MLAAARSSNSVSRRRSSCDSIVASMSPASVRTTTPPCEIRRSPISVSPARLPTRACSCSFAPARRSRSAGLQSTVSRREYAVAHVALRSACSSTPIVASGSATTFWRMIFSAISKASSTRSRSADASASSCAGARRREERLGEREALGDRLLGALDALVVAGLEALLARRLGDRLGLLARDADQRGALLAGALEELVEPADAARRDRRRRTASRRGACVGLRDDRQPAGARGLRAGDDLALGHG